MLAEIVIGILSVVLFIVLYGRKWWILTLPPGPIPIPLIGNTILYKKDPHGFLRLTELAQTYGNVYRLYCGSTLIVIINGYDAVYDALVKKADIFTDRPQLFVPLIGVSKGTGLTYNSGEAWKRLRRLTLTSLRNFGVGKKSLEERIYEEIDVISKLVQAANGSPIRLKPHLLSAATNIICSVMFGERFEYGNSRFTQLTGVLEEIFKLNAPFAKENFFYLTRFLPSGKELIRKRSAAITKVKNYLSSTIEEHKETYQPENIRDFIDMYLKTSKDENNTELYNEANIYKIIVDLFLAGGETTGTSLDWCILYMVKYPWIQDRCRQELYEVVGRRRRPSLSDRGSMPYLEATLLEVQRIANTLTFSLPHVANSDSDILGFAVPKDTIVIANLYSVHMDPKYWETPKKFIPERFLSDDGCLIRKDAFVPFSIGPRLCVGEPLARMELFLFFTCLLQTFEFSIDPEEGEPSTDGIQALTLTPLQYKVKATYINR